ncbi:MAG: hypothetical protein ACR2LM_15280 [Pyrinomonadaceae bacterium]
MTLLHILNGETTETLLGQTAVAGERFSFRDALIDGPTPADANAAEWRQLRSDHLSTAYDVDRDKCGRELERQEEVFASFSNHDEVVLWFESDLFCQLNMLYVLDWFGRHNHGSTKLTLICIDRFPGRPSFRGLGELTPEQLASLFVKRAEVSADELDLAAKAWRAYRAPHPGAVEQLIDGDTTALPFLKRALQLHLERFPSVRNGLGRIENRGLELVASGLTRFVDLLPRFLEAEAGYGLGDAQFWNALMRIAQVPRPLLHGSDEEGGAGPLRSDRVKNMSFEITEAGRAVLNGEADFLEMNGIDLWLGGVHLNEEVNVWRWDEQGRKLILE